jgi:glyoxylase-like metal-dependent hydrolase (beta-lactamase superfamily II)
MKAVTHMNGNAKVRLDPQENDTNDLLNWDVFVTPGIPTVWSDLPPGTKQLMWSPISSTLIYGKRDAVLVDAFITAEQAGALVDWVIASGKNLTTIYATHGHSDHFFGASTVLQRSGMTRAGALRPFSGRRMLPCVSQPASFPRPRGSAAWTRRECEITRCRVG